MVIDQGGTPRERWELSQAWPTKYAALPDVDANANEIAIESPFSTDRSRAVTTASVGTSP